MREMNGIPMYCMACGDTFGSLEGHKCSQTDPVALKAIWEAHKKEYKKKEKGE